MFPYLEAQVELDDGLEMERVRAGLFRTDAVTVLRADGERYTYAPEPFTVFGTYDDGTVAVAGIEPGEVLEYLPLRELEVGPSGAFRLEPPLPLRDDKQRLVVWYDEDLDGVFELSDSASSECGRNPKRAFDEYDGAELLLQPLLDHGHPFMLATAWAWLGDEASSSEVHLEAQHAEGWIVRLGRGNCAPR